MFCIQCTLLSAQWSSSQLIFSIKIATMKAAGFDTLPEELLQYFFRHVEFKHRQVVETVQPKQNL